MEKLKKTLSNVATSLAPPIYHGDTDGQPSLAHRRASQRSPRNHLPVSRLGRSSMLKPSTGLDQPTRQLARNDWYRERTRGREIEYNVFVHLEELMAELKEHLYSGKRVQEHEHIWDLYEVLGTCVGTLLHKINMEERERKGVEKRVVELEGRLKEMEKKMGAE